MHHRAGRAPLVVIATAALFATVILWLVVASFVPRQVAVFEPTAGRHDGSAAPLGAEPPSRRTDEPSSRRVDTITIDARDPDRWRFFAFDRGLLEAPDTAGWDLAVRRFRVITSGAAAALRGTLDTVAQAPDTGYEPTVFARDTVNPVLGRWYRYGFFSHLLRPEPRVYAIRLRDGRAALLEFLSYYCPGPGPGCVTLRYKEVGQSGSWTVGQVGDSGTR
jgi:hypothetical protein